MSGPLKPSEVRAAKVAALPEEVFTVVNRLIAEAWDGYAATVKQKDLVLALTSALGIDRAEVFRRKLCDFEEAYRLVGWDVEYDKPGYNESYDATFSFTHGKRA